MEEFLRYALHLLLNSSICWLMYLASSNPHAHLLSCMTTLLACCAVLRLGSALQENIITMVQDDLAKNFMNPHPGKIYNRPGGPNVYKDVTLVRLLKTNSCVAGESLMSSCTRPHS